MTKENNIRTFYLAIKLMKLNDIIRKLFELIEYK